MTRQKPQSASASKARAPICKTRLIPVNKLNKTGDMAFYYGELTGDECGRKYHDVVRAFNYAAEQTSQSKMVVTTINPSGCGYAGACLEFAVTADISSADHQKIVAAVREKTGVSMKVRFASR